MTAIVIITGGGGFLGQRLAQALLDRKSIVVEGVGEKGIQISKIVLADIAFASSTTVGNDDLPAVVQVQGDVSDRKFCDSLFEDHVKKGETSAVSIFHLGAVMSGDGERDFDLCMRVNLHGCMNMLEAARTVDGITPKFVFISAGATIGAGADTDYVQADDTISDASRATPHTTYGMTKACAELLVSDYARRGFVHGRGVRLPTIAVRAGAPNAAITGCYSGVVREPLAGKESILPIAANVLHAVTSARAAVNGMLLMHDLPEEKVKDVLGYDRTVFLPAAAVSLGELQEAMVQVVDDSSHGKLGKITYQVDEKLSSVVGSFPAKVDAKRALELGIPSAPTAADMVREYMEDFPDAIVDGIKMRKEEGETDIKRSKVAVVTGAGSGIGQAVAIRLADDGWNVVLVGRRMQKLKDTRSEMKEPSVAICVPADVTVERDVIQLFETVAKTYGRVDLLFNNAGINSPAARFEDVLLKDFESVQRVNVTGPFLCAREAMKLMKSTGTGGRIINNGSISAHVPRPHSACYTTSKHAVSGLTKTLALDGRNINVACGQIDFGNVVTALSKATNNASKGGALQPNGTKIMEPSMDMCDAVETFMAMANLPIEANVLQMTVMATGMPFVGRG